MLVLIKDKKSYAGTCIVAIYFLNNLYAHVSYLIHKYI